MFPTAPRNEAAVQRYYTQRNGAIVKAGRWLLEPYAGRAMRVPTLIMSAQLGWVGCALLAEPTFLDGAAFSRAVLTLATIVECSESVWQWTK